MGAVIYSRYSSDKQRALSVTAQVRACEKYASDKGYTVVDIYKDEAISGKDNDVLNRKGYQQLMRDVGTGKFDTVLVHKYDRIARSLSESSNLDKDLQKKGIRLISITEDFGENIVVKGLFWSMAENYSINLAAETRKGLSENAHHGMFTGGVAPFGYNIVDKKYVVNELEAEYVRRIYRCAAEHKGYTEILKEMEERGIRGKRGKVIKYTQVYEMLRNEKYMGVLAFSPHEEKDRALRRSKPNAIRVEGALPVIIERALFEEVQGIMDGRKQIGKTQNTYLCSGLVRCACGAKMHVFKTSRKGHDYYRYRCSVCCGMSGVDVAAVDNSAKMYLGELLSKKNQAMIATALRNYQSHAADTIAEFKSRIAELINEKEAQYDALMSNLSSGVLPTEVAAAVGEKMKTLLSEIEKLRNTPPPEDYTVKHILQWLEQLKTVPDEKAVHLLIERIDISKDEETMNFNITSTLGSLLQNDEQQSPFYTEKPTTPSDKLEVVGNLGCGGRI